MTYSAARYLPLITTLFISLFASANSALAQVPKTCRWTGQGANNKWSTPANWDMCNNSVPQNGDSIVFLNTAKQGSNENDIGNLTIGGLALVGEPGDGTAQNPLSHWNVTGLGITLTGSIHGVSLLTPTNVSPSFLIPITVGSNAVTFGNDPIAPGDTSVRLVFGDINLNGFTPSFNLQFPVTVAGLISGAGGLQKKGLGALTLNDNTYTGPTDIQQGTLIANTSQALGADGAQNGTTIETDATLQLGNGAAVHESVIVANGNIAVGAGATATYSGPIVIAPSLNNVVIFNLTFNVAGTLTTTGRIVTSDVRSIMFLVGGGTLMLSNLPTNFLPTLSMQAGTLNLNNVDLTIGTLAGQPGTRILLGSATLTINQAAAGLYSGTVEGTGSVVKTGLALLVFGGTQTNTYTGKTTVQAGNLTLSKTAPAKTIVGPISVTGGTLTWANSDQVDDAAAVTVNAPGTLDLASFTDTIGSLAGDGSVLVGFGTISIGANNTSTTFSGTITGNPGPGGASADRIVKVGTGTLTLTGNNSPGFQTAVEAGTLLSDGQINGTTVFVRGGTFGGNATILDNDGLHTFVSNLSAVAGAISPGHSPGIIHTDATEVRADGSLVIELNGTTPGTGYDQLNVKNNLTLQPGAQLVVKRGFGPPRGTSFTIVTMAPGLTVNGTFAGLPEGGTVDVDQQRFTISYHGGDGNDISLTALDNPPPITYYLSEGATGGFFDEDILIANPNTDTTPVALTFSKENGSQVTTTRSLPPNSHLTVHVNAIPGMEATAASAQVTSESGLPLVVERSMFWDKTTYAGSTGSSVDKPAADWFFAEGSQGFFDTFVLVNNPNATATDVTFTFFRESEPTVVKTITVGPTTRLTLHAGDVPELVNRSFGIAVHATAPIMAERSMYFGTTATRLWSGGTESAGVTSTSTHWFLAEGATGGFFDTFILLSNPNNVQANVTLQYLLDTGETVTVPKTIAANARLTTNIEAEDDVRLHNAAVSTVVNADVPVIAERSMYWPGAAVPWGEGHNSFGVVDAGLRFGLAEGRTGGPLNFHTYILLANPQTTTANVTVTYLRENAGAPVTKTYVVPPTSRFNIDTGAVTELHDEAFGAIVQVTNGVPIIVERSMYWDSNGFQFSGGTNATGIRLP